MMGAPLVRAAGGVRCFARDCCATEGAELQLAGRLRSGSERRLSAVADSWDTHASNCCVSTLMLDGIHRRCSGTALAIAVCAGAIFTVGCTNASRSQVPGRVETPQPESIGIARMEADGTIILQLRAVEGDTIGEALFRYPKDHPEYGAVLKHLGGLRPGETKPVPPWPDRQ